MDLGLKIKQTNWTTASQELPGALVGWPGIVSRVLSGSSEGPLSGCPGIMSQGLPRSCPRVFLGCARTASGSLMVSLGLSLDVLGCSWGPLGIYLRAPRGMSWDGRRALSRHFLGSCSGCPGDYLRVLLGGVLGLAWDVLELPKAPWGFPWCSLWVS